MQVKTKRCCAIVAQKLVPKCLGLPRIGTEHLIGDKSWACLWVP